MQGLLLLCIIPCFAHLAKILSPFFTLEHCTTPGCPLVDQSQNHSLSPFF